MPGRATAFAVLGLEPGADATAIEQAYRRLIKQYHPDREGGDGAKAAEIIHAYRELRGGRALADPLQFNDDHLVSRSRGRLPVLAMLVLVALGVAALSLRPDILPHFSNGAPAVRLSSFHGGRRDVVEPMQEPLHAAAINAAIELARSLYRTQDELALASVSRDCQRRFRDKPGTEWLDRCAAFDNAVIGLQDRDPLRDGGPFAPLAVTGRQWGAASALSDDYLAIDGRLDRIRMQVELALVPTAIDDSALSARPRSEAPVSAPSHPATPTTGKRIAPGP